MAYETFAFIYDEVMDENTLSAMASFFETSFTRRHKKYFGTGMRYWSISGCLCKRWI
jgi:hypothetical protein